MDIAPIIQKLVTSSKQQAYDDILALYKQQGRGIVSFLYFANVMHWRLLEPMSERANLDEAKRYKDALENADMLLPDGIALQWFARSITKKSYENLNGTDFIPYVFDQLILEEKTVHVGICGVYDETIGKSVDEITKAVHYMRDRRGIRDVYMHQTMYHTRGEGFNWEGYKHELEKADADVRLFLMCTGTPHQEIRTAEHADFFKQHKILVFNAGGLLDYRSGFETRAPDRVVKARVLETPRRILQHPKKNAKKLGWMFGIIRYWWNILRFGVEK